MEIHLKLLEVNWIYHSRKGPAIGRFVRHEVILCDVRQSAHPAIGFLSLNPIVPNRKNGGYLHHLLGRLHQGKIAQFDV